MSKRLSLYTILACTALGSAAIAAQPTIRAGSISLNSGIKANANTPGASVNNVRGSSVPKFSANIVPVTTSQNSNNVSSSALESLRQEIDRLKRELGEARAELVDNQLTSDQIEAQINNLHLTETNDDLRSAIAELKRENQEAVDALDTIQAQTDSITESINNDIDNRLLIHGVIDENKNRTFAMKGEVGANSDEVKDLIETDLKTRGIIDENETLQVATKSEIEPTQLAAKLDTTFATVDTVNTLAAKAITTENVSDNNVKNALSEAGFAKKTELPQINADTVSAALANSSTIDNAVVAKLKDKQILDDDENLKVAKAEDVTTNALKAKLQDDFALKGEVGIDTAAVTTLLKNKQLLKDDESLNVAKADEVTTNALKSKLENEFALKGEAGIDTEAVTTLLKNKQLLKDDESLNVAKADEVTTSALKSKLENEFALKGESVELDTAEVIAALNQDNALETEVFKSLRKKDILDDEDKLKLATQDEVSSLSRTLATVNGSVTTPNSILYKIKNDPSIQDDLRGTSVSADDVKEDIAAILKADSGFQDAARGPEGPAGTSFTYKGSLASADLLPNSCEQGDAYSVTSVNSDNISETLLYICACNGDTCAFADGVQFGQKGEPGDSAWKAYCLENYSIVSALYEGIEPDCSNFRSSQYNAIMGGADAYCLSLAKDLNQNRLVIDSGIGKKLDEKLVAVDSTKTIAKLRGQNLTTILKSKFNDNQTFMEACKAKYNEIMAGDDAEKPEITYCKAPAANYTDGTLNRDLARKLYPNKSIADDCSNFSAEMYAGMVGGAQAFCSNLTATFNTVDLTKGAGLKLTKVYATEKNVSLESAKDALEALQVKTPAARLADTGFSILDKCIANYNSIMNGEDAEKPEITYCKSPAANYTDGTLNRDLARKLYPNKSIADDCSNFSAEMYAGMVGGAQAFCSNLTATFNTVDLTKGAGLKLTKVYATEKNVSLESAKDALEALQVKTPAARLADTGFSILDKCIANYNSIMNGEDATPVETQYCLDNYSIVKALYDDTTEDCSNFTNARYTAIMGGSEAYCLSLAQNPTVLGDLSSGIGKRLANTFTAAKMREFQGKTSTVARMTATGFKLSKTGSDTGSFMDACKARYDEIMAGNDATPVETQYCLDNYGIVKALYDDTTEDCSNFTNARYTAIMGGSDAYCLSLAQNPTVLGNLSSGIGKKLADTFTIAKMQEFQGKTSTVARMTATGFKLSKTGSETGSFMDACKARYNEIMSGADGESAAYTWCKAHTFNASDARLTTTASTVKKMSAAKTLNAGVARNNSFSELTKVGNEGYFTSMDACLAAVEADPSLMGGESAEDAKFNADVNDGKKAFTLDINGKNTLIAARNSFAADIKGQDGKTVIPNLNLATGQITYTLSDTPTVPTSVSGLVTTGNLQTQDVRNAFTTAGVTTEDTLVSLGLVTRNTNTNSLELAPTFMMTSDIGDANTATGQAIRNAGVMMAGDIGNTNTTTGQAMANAGVMMAGDIGNANSTTGQAIRNAGVMMAGDIGNANSTTGQAMRTAGVMMASDVGNANTVTGQAMRSASVSQMADLGLVTVTGTGENQTVRSNAITAGNLAGQLQTTLRDTSVQNTLRASGVMMSSDANANMFTANDVMNMLGSLQVNNDGSVGIKTTGTSAQNLVDKLSTAGVSAADINKLKATTNIASSVATVVASTTNAGEIDNIDSCNEIEYMFWNDQKNECQKCPDETTFKGKEFSTPSARCVCEDPAMSLSYVDGEYHCIQANSDECLSQPETYWNGSCNVCPARTHFDEGSETRCVCDDAGFKFNASSGQCEKLDASECEPGTYWSPSGNVCTPCPEETEYEDGKGCVCKEAEQMFSTVMGTCMKDCPEESEFNPETRMCVCKDEGTLNENEWSCEY